MSRLRRSLWLAGLLAFGPLLLASPTAAQAPGARGPFSALFRDAPLTDALAEVARLTEIDLVFAADLVEGRRAYCSVRGASAEALLRCVLTGTGLDFVRSSSGSYILIAALHEPAPPARLAGRVVDAESGGPMPFAHVLLADAGTTADEDGYFAFGRLLPGTYRVTATYVGFEPAVVEGVWVEPGADTRVVIRLQPRPASLTPVVIDGLTQRLPSAALGTAEPGFDRPAGFPGTIDVMRGAAGALGVSAGLPLADLHIQGGATAEHVTRLDGVPVRDPVALGRHLGAFSPLAVGAVMVHKAGFGVEHGSLLTGALDLRHDLGAVRPAVTVQVDPAALNARLAMPVTGPGGVEGAALLAYRRSVWTAYRDPGLADLLARSNRVDPLITSAWLERPVRTDQLTTLEHRPDVAFSDAHAALHLRPDAFSSLRASLYHAGNFVAAEQSAALREAEGERLLVFEDIYDWANWAGQARYSRLLGAQALAAVRVRGSHHASSYDYRYAEAPTASDGRPASAILDAMEHDDTATVYRSLTAHRLVEAGVDAELGLSLAPGREVELGLTADLVDARFEGGNAVLRPFEVEAQAGLLSGYLRGRYGLGARTSVEAGTRLTWLPATGRTYAEPRAALRYDGALAGTDGYALRLAAGLYRQFVNGYAFRSAGPAALVPELWFWLPPSAGAAPARAVHLAFDGLFLPAGGWALRAETYVRWEPHVPALDLPALLADGATGSPRPLAPGDVVTASRGRALGAGAEVQWTGRLGTAALRYSAEQARRTFPLQPQPEAVAVPWEQPHRLSFDGRLALGRGVGLAGAARGVWGRRWGYRHAYYDYFADPGRSPLAAEAGRPQAHGLPPLLLLDVKGTYERRLAGSTIRLELGAANLLDRANVQDWSFDGTAQRSEVARTLPGRRLTFALRFDV